MIVKKILRWCKLATDFGYGLRAMSTSVGGLTSPEVSELGERFQNLRAKLAAMSEDRSQRYMYMLLGRAVLSSRSGDTSLLRSLPSLAPTRDMAVWCSLKGAWFDSEFRRLTRVADAARDARRWREGAIGYRAALGLYKWHVGYLVQLGHCSKEEGEWIAAEIAYRDALALGATVDDVLPNLDFVVRRSGGCAQVYPPNISERMEDGTDKSWRMDVVTSREIRLLSWLFHGLEDPSDAWVLQCLRAAPERDQAVARMVSDPAFLTVNRSLVALAGRGGRL